MSHGPMLDDSEIMTILERISDGVSLKESCEMSGRNYSNVIRRIGQSEELSKLYARVREEYQHVRVMEMHQVANNKDIDVARARLICDNIKWEAARVCAKHYGDRLDVTQTNKVELNDEQLANRLSVLLRKAGITEADGGEGAAESPA